MRATKGSKMFKEQIDHTFDLKEVSEDGEFEGYASVFGNVDEGSDIVAKGAFKKSIKSKGLKGIKLLWQHDSREPIGVWKELREDDRGLFVKGQLITAIRRSAEVLELMRAGVLDGLSVGFQTLKAMRDETNGTRKIIEANLWEISLVTFPMNPKATVSSVKDVTIRDVERILRDADMPNSFAKMVARYGYDGAKQRLSKEQRDAGLGSVADALRQATKLMEKH